MLLGGRAGYPVVGLHDAEALRDLLLALRRRPSGERH